MKPLVTLIVAMDMHRGIGRNNELPWDIPEDLKHFRNTTMGHPIIMGRKTFASIGRPLPMRKNIVVSRNPHWGHEGCFLRSSLEEAIEDTAEEAEAFVIGGAEIYKQAISLAHRLIVTHIHAAYKCDTFFPAIEPGQWRVEAEGSREHSVKEGVDYTIVTYVNKQKEGL